MSSTVRFAIASFNDEAPNESRGTGGGSGGRDVAGPAPLSIAPGNVGAGGGLTAGAFLPPHAATVAASRTEKRDVRIRRLMERSSNKTTRHVIAP
jgi:hypothetical protein